MRKHLTLAVALSAALCATPAIAQEAVPEERATAAEFLSDPENQAQMAVMADVFGKVLMQLPVGRLAEAMGRMGDGRAPDIDPDARLGDVMGEDGHIMRARMVERLPMMMTAMADMSGELEAMLPELREAMERATRRLPRD